MKLRRLAWTRVGLVLATSCTTEHPPAEHEVPLVPVPQVRPVSVRPEPRGPTEAAATLEVPRVYAKTRFVWIQPKPDGDADWIGYLWTGGAVALKSEEQHFGPGCDGPWYEVEPCGFVCTDDKRATLDADDAEVVAVRSFRGRTNSAWPFRFGESLGLVRYPDLPTPELQARNESDLPAHLRQVARARAGRDVEELRGVDLSLPEIAPPPMPLLERTVHEARTDLRAHSTVAYTTEARWGDRGFLLSADYAWIPKDRVREYPRSHFHGVRLDEDARLPLAFFRTQDRPKYARLGDRVTRGNGVFRRLEHVELTGKALDQDGVRYLETREPGVWVKADDAVVPELPARTPWGAPLRSGGANEDLAPVADASDETWIDVSVTGGWLLAFEGTTPRYATLISPGRGGPPVGHRPLLETSSTPLGTYTINTKIVAATMEGPNDFVHSDVPWVQNFTGPYALHAAYWHDDWGDPVSGGCVNLSPLDARYLFRFTEPRLPPGWYAIRREPRGPATRVVLHR